MAGTGTSKARGTRGGDDEIVYRRHANGRGMVAPGSRVAATAFVETGAYVEPGANVGERAWIGAGSWIDRDAMIGHSAFIGANVHVGPEAIVGPGARIGSYSRIGDSAVIATGARVDRDTFVAPGSRFGLDESARESGSRAA
ncbi:hypothetical protein GRS96_08605 [Rathayibacter sp. VKM Ac-2803]|uniref:hypothetical protein n=1 Tax=unclassified Rathayibacter TaxID=2609250 RepID=UPI00135A1C50|nr:MULTISPECIES: hypothetical protein [unclassified Rathayibacter]MWV49336.1 hypothetical protein [Rathayibacter sp. VKM Ac-2803]MWV59914.1 hypothetical protein [Rathayibacter sp. VKM Ac-2754]